jgi:hypothetical protein
LAEPKIESGWEFNSSRALPTLRLSILLQQSVTVRK